MQQNQGHELKAVSNDEARHESYHSVHQELTISQGKTIASSFILEVIEFIPKDFKKDFFAPLLEMP